MKANLLTGLLIVAGLVHAGPVTNVVREINTSKLYVYDAAGEELGELNASVVRREFTKVSIQGEMVEGLPVQDINDEEGLIAVALSQYDEPVWIETMAVEIWPGNRLDCPEATVGESQIEQSGMTIGFGDHCKQAGASEAED